MIARGGSKGFFAAHYDWLALGAGVIALALGAAYYVSVLGEDPDEAAADAGFSYEATLKAVKAHMDLWRRALPKTYLVISDDVAMDNACKTDAPAMKYARKLGIGFRDDSIMVGSEAKREHWFHDGWAREFAETTPVGGYAVEIDCREARRRLGDKWPEKLATSFEVKTAFAPVEYAHLSSDRALADEMAKLTGGEVILLSSSTNQLPTANYQLPTDFGAGRSEVVDRIENHVWDHPSAFIVLAAALILVWILRKRRGLA